jgi:hypothetical protein
MQPKMVGSNSIMRFDYRALLITSRDRCHCVKTSSGFATGPAARGIFNSAINDCHRSANEPSEPRPPSGRGFPREGNETENERRRETGPPWRWHKERIEKWSGKRVGIRTRIRKRIKITDPGRIFAVETVCW